MPHLKLGPTSQLAKFDQMHVQRILPCSQPRWVPAHIQPTQLHRTLHQDRRGDRCRTSTVGQDIQTSTIDAASNALPPATQLVDEVLEAIKDTDAGATVTPDLRAQIDANLSLLEQHGLNQGNPLDNPQIFGNFDVAYVSSTDRSPPAGGRFRSKLGKSLFRTTRLCQSVLQSDLAINKVEFLLFGLVPGYVGLRGKLTPLQQDQRTVRVQFEPPVLRLGGLVLRIGPPSSVVLSTTYLDERVRLGKGSRGSLFVFTRGGGCDEACMEQVGLERSSGWAVAAAWAAVAGVAAASAALVASRGVFQTVAGTVLGGLLAAVMYTVWRGGQARDNEA